MRFIHTADLQIGKPFQWASGHVKQELRARQILQEAREKVIDRLGSLAIERGVSFILVAGDFFDANTLSDDVVARTCRRLEQIEVPVFILPGNHDAACGPASIYRRSQFERHKPGHVKILDERVPLVTQEGRAVILPAPVKRHDELGDPTEHILPSFGKEEAPDAIRIGLAHGGVQDFGSEDAASRIAPDRAERGNLDYLALGDWHGLKEIGPRTWYSGTPEPDSFKQNSPGHTLVVELEGPGATPHIEAVETGQLTWTRKEEELHSEEDVQALKSWAESLEDPLHSLVRLELRGTLSLEAMENLKQVQRALEDVTVHVRHRSENLRLHASQDEIDTIATDGYLRAAVDQLQEKTRGAEEEAVIANRALQMLYHLKHEKAS